MDEEQAEETECKPDAPSCAPPLRAGDFEGLDEAMIATLGGAHIESLSDVFEADALVLAEIMGVTYANARRTQYLARAAEPKAEPMAEVAADPPVSIHAPNLEPEDSPVSLSFGARWGESHPSPSDADPAPARKFWEPKISAAAVKPDLDDDELVIEMPAPEVEAAEAPSDEVSTPEEQVSEEQGPGGDATPDATPDAMPEPAFEPSDDPGPKRVPPPEPPMPEAATYGTPWPQDSGPELSRPLHVRFPSELPKPEALQAEDASTAQGCDRPLNWDFNLTGPSVRFPDNAPGEPPSSYSASGESANDLGSDGVGGPFA